MTPPRLLLVLLVLAGCGSVEPATDSAIPMGEQRGGLGPLGSISAREGVVLQREQWFPDAWFPGRR